LCKMITSMLNLVTTAYCSNFDVIKHIHTGLNGEVSDEFSFYVIEI